MFNFVPQNAQIPSVTFTKAELAYILAILTPELSPIDKSSMLEMVELRFYLNRIKDRVDRAISDGTLQSALMKMTEEKGAKESPTSRVQVSSIPTMKDLRTQFPTLTEEEIRDVIEKAKAEKQIELEKSNDKENLDRSPSPFIVQPAQKKKPWGVAAPPSSRDNKDSFKENSQNFAKLLGSF